MNWLLPASIATAGGVFFLFLANAYLYRQYQEKFMGVWALAWGAYFLRYLCMIAGLLAGESVLTRGGYYLMTIAAALLLFHGTLVFIDRSQRPWTMIAGGGLGVWVVVALALHLPPAYLNVPIFEFLGAIGIYCGIQLLKEGREKQERATRTVGWIFVAWGIHQADYPLLRPIAWFAPWGYVLGALLAFSLALGLIVMHFERLQQVLRKMTISAAPLRGEELFREIARTVASLFGARYAMLGRLNPDLRQVESLAVWRDDGPADSRVCPLADSLFEKTLRLGFDYHHRGVGALFPENALVRELRAEGYMGVRLCDPDGTAIGVLMVLSDRPLRLTHNDRVVLEYFAARATAETLRMEMEQRARSSEERFRHLAESLADWIWEIDARGVYTYASPKVEMLLGYPPTEIIGRTPFDFMPPDEAERVRRIFDRLAEEKLPIRDLENWNVTRDGRRVCLLTNGVPILSTSGELLGYRGVDRDVTEQKERLGKTLLVGRLSALGEMASGVAHEINNPINGVLNCAELLQSRLPPDDANQEIAARILRDGQRISRIVHSLLSVAHPGRHRFERIALAELVDAVLALFEGQLAMDGIDLVQDCPPDLPALAGERQQLEQMLLNLLINARHALNEKFPAAAPGKRLTVSARLCGPDRLCLEIHDFGIGIRAELMGRLFDPFFTTKPAGVGTGLGLGLCREIALRHGGEIRLESEFGHFTRVTVELPLAASIQNSA